VNEVIVRRGPNRDSVRAPFASLLADFETTHQAWLIKHGDATRVPELSREARKLFADSARAAGLPVSQREARLLADQLPKRVQARPVAEGIRWSGDLAPAQITAPWSDEASLVISCPSAPAELGTVASALVRAAAHSARTKLLADPALWQPEAARLTSNSLHAEGMNMPHIENTAPGGNNLYPEVHSAELLAQRLHQAMDRWTLTAIDRH